MRKHRKFVAVLAIIAILVGLGVAGIKSVYNNADKEEPQLTADDALQMLNKDVANLDYTVKSNPIIGELPEASIGETNIDFDEEIIAVFLIDTSGSMKTKSENKLAKVQEAISSSLQYIGSNSFVGLISYSSGVTVNVPIAQFDETQARKINGELYNLKSSGGTHMYEAIAVGMKLIEDELDLHPNARVMMFVLSDGQPSNDAKTLDFVEEYVRLLNIPIHTIGYGRDVDKVELKKLAAINEATFTYVETEDVVETFKNLFAENF